MPVPVAPHRQVGDNLKTLAPTPAIGMAAAKKCRGCGMAAQLVDASSVMRCSYGSFLVWEDVRDHV